MIGTFDLEGTQRLSSDDENSSDLGESGPAILMPQAARVQIRAAQQLLENNLKSTKEKTLAKQYLMDVRTGRNRLESKTIESLSEKLASAQKKEGVLLEIEKEARHMLVDPKVGDPIKFDLGTLGTLKMSIEGWRYADGTKFHAPQGSDASVDSCKRFMSEYIDKGVVMEAMKARDKIRKELDTARQDVEGLAVKYKADPEQNTDDELGSGKEVSQSSAQKTLDMKRLHTAKVKVTRLREKFDAAEDLVAQKQQEALNAATNFVRDANFRAREIELNRRERCTRPGYVLTCSRDVPVEPVDHFFPPFSGNLTRVKCIFVRQQSSLSRLQKHYGAQETQISLSTSPGCKRNCASKRKSLKRRRRTSRSEK